jgi:hypothetical protein
MNQKTLTILGLVTAGLLVAGFVASRDSGSSAKNGDSLTGTKLFPDLAARVNDAVELRIVNKDETVSLKKDGASWGAADKGGYPVAFDKVKGLIVGIAEMDVLAKMTANAAHHVKLGVEEPTGAEATSKRVIVKDDKGTVLADVVIGKPKPHEGFGGRGSLWVRKGGDDQVYEVGGQISIYGGMADWLQREVSKLESTRVKRTLTQHADGNQLSISKAAPADQNFNVDELPAGAELQWAGVANGVAGALQYLSLDDVQKNENFDLAGATTTRFECWDGLVVTAKTIERDAKTWVTLSASFDESLRPAAPAGPEAPTAIDDPNAPPPPKPPEQKNVELVQKEVEELNLKWSPWVYSVPGYSAANLRKKLTDLLKQEEPPAPPADSTLPEGHSADDGHDHGAPAPVAPPADGAPADPMPATKPEDGSGADATAPAKPDQPQDSSTDSPAGG